MKKSLLSLLVCFSFLFGNESSYPYISGYTWWHFCDWKLTNPDFGKTTSSRFDPEKVREGDTIFVEYTCLEEFARDYLPHLKEKVILVTANYGYKADSPLPGPYAYLIEDERIAAWFVQNIDRAPTEKIIPMPIGLASNYWPHGNNKLLDLVIPNALKNLKRSIFIYLNFSLSPERESCVNHFTSMGIPLEPRKSYADYLVDLAKSIFVISPEGGGIDCHRTWEALLLGCYPVVRRTTLNPLFEDLPVVVVEDWKEVSFEFLEKKYQELKAKSWPRDKLYISYWFQKIKDLQNQLRKPDLSKKIEEHVSSNSWKNLYYDVLPQVIRNHGYQNIVEIGVALGGHAETILQHTNITNYFGIDPYVPYDPNDGFQQDVGNYSTLGIQFNFNSLFHWVRDVRLERFGDRCNLIRKTSLTARSDFPDESLDCVFIDGDHRYEAVFNDLEAWFPKLKKGHLMIGDDYWMPAVSSAVDTFFATHDRTVFFFTSQSGYRLWAVYK